MFIYLTTRRLRLATAAARLRKSARQYRVVLFWSHNDAMPVNLSIKNAPDAIVDRLRRRAAAHHRSLQGELLAIVEAAVKDEAPATPREVLARVGELGLRTPSESVAILRAKRDA